MLARTYPPLPAYATPRAAYPGSLPRRAPAASTRPAALRGANRSGAGKRVVAVASALLIGWILYAAPQDRRAALGAMRTTLGSLIPTDSRFRFDEVHARQLEIDGHTVLYVEGSLRNVDKRLRKAPAVRVTLLGDDDQPIYSWKSKAAKADIEPERETSFQTRLLSPPEKFKSISISLANEG